MHLSITTHAPVVLERGSAYAEYRAALDWEELASAVYSDRLNGVNDWRPGTRVGMAV
jgi:hypothetical protein